MNALAVAVVLLMAGFAGLLTANALLSYAYRYDRVMSDFRAFFAGVAWVFTIVAVVVVRRLGLA